MMFLKYIFNRRLISFLIIISLQTLTISAHGSPTDAHRPSEKTVSLGSIPQGYKLINQTMHFSADMDHVTYVAYRSKNEKIVRFDDSSSRVFYAILKGTPQITPKKNHIYYVAYQGNAGDKAIAVIDGHEGQTFDAIDNITFSPDENSYAYRAKEGKYQCIVVNGKKSRRYDGIVIKNNFKFSPDSKHFAYVAFKKGSGCVLVLDGKESQPYNFIEDILYSDDSQHLAFKARKEKKGKNEQWCVVIDNKESNTYDRILNMLFSPDGNHFAYIVFTNDNMSIVYDGDLKATHKFIGEINFSLDSKRFAYSFVKGKSWHWMVDGQDGPGFDYPAVFYFSADSTYYSYVMVKDKKMSAVLNGDIGNNFNKILQFTLSSGGHRTAYAGVNDSEKACIVVDGKQGPFHNSVGPPYFSPDTHNVVYKAWDKNKGLWSTFFDGNPVGSRYFTINKYFFSPDSKHFAFQAMMMRPFTWTMVLDNKELGAYKGVGLPWFSEDGNHIAYFAAKTPDEWHIVVDGRMYDGKYAAFLKGTPIIFDDNTHLHTVGFKSFSPTYEAVRIEIVIPEDSRPQKYTTENMVSE